MISRLNEILFVDFFSNSFCFNFFLVNIGKEMSLPGFRTKLTDMIPVRMSVFVFNSIFGSNEIPKLFFLR